MCRSVPHTLAASTWTSTSSSPGWGIATSSIRSPGRGSSFRTALIVSGIDRSNLLQMGRREQGYDVRSGRSALPELVDHHGDDDHRPDHHSLKRITDSDEHQTGVQYRDRQRADEAAD